MGKRILVLGLNLGDNEDKIKEQLSKYIVKKGLHFDGILVRSSKEGVLEFASKCEDEVTIITNRVLQERSPYTVEDLDALITVRSVKRIVFIMSDKYKRTDYVKELYGISLYDGIFVADENRYDLKGVLDLLANERDRADAKDYYGLNLYVPKSVKQKINEQVGVDLSEMIAYIENDKTGSIDDRINHVKNKVTSAELNVIMKNLSEETKITLIRKGGYETFYANETEEYKNRESQAKKAKTIIKEKTQYVTVSDAIGVISFTRDAGTTLVALNLARELADVDGLKPSFIQLPNTSSDAYARLGFSKYFGSGFVNHFVDVVADGVMPSDENTYCKVGFIVENPLVGDYSDWDDNATLRLLNGASSPKIIDFGIFYKDYNNLIPALSQLFVVIDDTKDVSEEEMQSIKDLGEAYPNLKISIVVNRCKDVSFSKAIRLINDELPYIVLPVFSNKDMEKLGNDILYPNIKGELLSLASLAGYEIANEVALPMPLVKQAPTRERTLDSGTLEIGVGAIERGVGATHTAIMLANSLKKSYKVAVVEQNGTRAFASFYNRINPNSQVPTNFVKYFTYQGVDYFALCEYGSFVANFRDDYDIVIVDFGETFPKDPSFLRMDKKIVCVNASPWKVGSLVRFYNDTRKKIDANCKFVYAVPFLPNGELGSIRKICAGSEVLSVPYCGDAFNPDDDAKAVLGHIVTMENKSKKAKKAFGFFGKR